MKPIRIIILLITLFAATVGYLKANKFVNLDPRESSLFLSEATLETKEIKIPGFPGAYNPSLIPFEEGYLLSFRVNSYNLLTYAKKLLNHRTSFLGVIQLDKQFNPTTKAQLIDVRSCTPDKQSSPQDARLFVVDGVIYAFFNDYAKPVARSQELFIGTLIKENGTFHFQTQPKQLRYAESVQKVEKNWSPFTYQDKLYVCYSVTPHTILEVDPKTGISTKIDTTKNQIDWNFGPLRGGTPSATIPNGYLTFFHSCKLGVPSYFSKKNGRVYYMGAYTFDAKPPFAIQKITPLPLASTDDYQINNPKKIMYPGGLVLSGDNIHVVWGQNDSNICVSTLDKEKLFSAMIDCPSNKE